MSYIWRTAEIYCLLRNEYERDEFLLVALCQF